VFCLEYKKQFFTRKEKQTMIHRKVTISTILATCLLALCAINASAQSASTFTGGLQAPSKMMTTADGNLLVAEGGAAVNAGRISILDRNGNRRTLVEGLPSGPTPEGGFSGPSGLELRGRTLYVSIGQGDGILPGPLQGTERPNPTPSSQLFSSVLAIEFGSSVDTTGGGFVLTNDDQLSFNRKPEVILKNADGESASLKVVVDFRDFTYNHRADFLGNVRPSNPFGLALIGKLLYTADAGQNLIWETNLNTGETRVLVYLNNKPNPLPFGPPFVEPVPDSIRAFGKQLLVTYLTGFPFAAGQSEVHKINRVNNSHVTFIGGLTTAIDVLPVVGADGQTRFYVLEFSANFLSNTPGRLLLFDSPTATPRVLAGGLISPTGMAFDSLSGRIFITEMFTGRVMQVSGN
jgi:hypothetical protein